jgi:hypothetical protein
LRQLIAILSSATQTGLAPRTAATGTRRLVEKTTRLAAAPGGVGKNLTQALGSLGYGSISEALNEGPIPYLENILKLTGGRPKSGKLGFGAREFMLLSSSLRNNMGQTRQFYQELSLSGNIAGTTDKYIDKHKDTWWYQRDRLRSAYEDTQISLMNALVPTMKSLANSLEVINDLFQALAPSIKQLIGLIALGAGVSILKNFFMRGGGGVGGGHSFAMSPPRLENSAESVPISYARNQKNLLSVRPHKELTAIRFMVVLEMFSEMCILHTTEVVFLLLVGDRLTVVSPLHLAFLVVQ